MSICLEKTIEEFNINFIQIQFGNKHRKVEYEDKLPWE